MHIPISIYRLQLNSQFTFAMVEKLLPYFKALYITDLYLSPILQAESLSTHGYNVIDPTCINRDLGGLDAFKSLSRAAKAHAIGLILDIVPNHMAATKENLYWMDVLEKGQASSYKYLFDIDWQASKALNHLVYRRFFDINELVALHAEDSRVFEFTHQVILRLIKEGDIQGLRVDHIDGLREPSLYLKRLREHTSRPIYTVVEKILAADERLPQDWLLEGTTGYDFLNQANRVLLKESGLSNIIHHYAHCMGKDLSLSAIIKNNLKKIIKTVFLAEFERLIVHLQQLIGGNFLELEDLLLELCASMTRYRCYSAEDRVYIHKLCETLPVTPKILKQKFNAILLLDFPESFTKDEQMAWRKWHTDWEVFTGPVMAKGFEDTTCYAYNPLLSLNEVGSGNLYFKPIDVIAAFHTYNLEKQLTYPYSINTTSTHDSKRSEDVRARINVLTELSSMWQSASLQWIKLNKDKKRLVQQELAPDLCDELVIYQTLLGAWPLKDSEIEKFKSRVCNFLTKAMRERKVHSSWAAPNIAYEDACLKFVDALFSDNKFINLFLSFEHIVAYYGMYNSLSQLTLKMTSPGIPDLYQGNETWRFNLVDPDNRQQIDYNLLQQLTSNLPLETLLNTWQDGRIKYELTKKLLNIRQNYHELFFKGEYVPLQVEGPHKNNIIAYARKYASDWLIVICTREYVSIVNIDKPWTSNNFTKEDRLVIPNIISKWHGLLVDKDFGCMGKGLSIKKVLQSFPVGLFLSIHS